jgi:hypothetical protein
MKEIEDRHRAAAQAAADTVPLGSAPPLRLPGRSGSRFSLPGRLRPGTGRRLIAPIATAAAVAAVVTVSLVVTDGVPGPRPARSLGGTAASCATGAAPSSTSSTTPSAADPSAQAALADIPPYYVVLTRPAATEAMVRATDTGAVLAALRPPSPYGMFTAVTAAANDRTFVLAAQPSPGSRGGRPTRFFLLCLNAAGHPTRGLTALPITAGPAEADVTGIALSPDGSRLAVIVRQGHGAEPGNSSIVVFTLATGSATEWQWPASGWIGNWKPYGSPLSWTANGQTLAFQAWREVETPQTPAAGPRLRQKDRVSLTTEVRLLDTAGPGGSLASSTLVVEWTASGSYVLGTNTIITPDGTKVVCVTSLPGLATERFSGVATEYSVTTGKIVAFPGAQPTLISAGPTATAVTPVQNVLWSSPTGSTLIVATSTGAGVLTGSQLTSIPGYPPLAANVAW